MLFRPWKPKGSDFYIRFYVEHGDGDFIGKKGGGLEITAASQIRKVEIGNFLRSHGIDVDLIGMAELHQALKQNSLLVFQRGGGKQNTRSSVAKPAVTDDGHSFSFANKTPEELFEDSLTLVPSKAPFKASTLKNGFIGMDHREPEGLKSLVESIPLETFSASLPNGDFVIGDRKNPTRELIVERKTITDFYTGIVRDDRHCHEQAERYFSYAQERAKEGVYIQVIWVIEAENQGKRLLYNTLPEVKQIDGMVSYLTVINRQSVVQSYGENHTAYLIAKFAQAFIEESLFYPVKVNDIRIDKTKSQRHAISGLPDQSDSNHGVVISTQGLEQMLSVFPGIKSNVAKELAKTGRSFAEIVSMSVDELKSVKGIGTQSAIKLHHYFNLKK
ncbi:MAG: hypothetical protein C9356_14825 [Oleiphilus sp.]|nr:MAG: hypothetical protein C9356_14825 [Oleiphilus sp.]